MKKAVTDLFSEEELKVYSVIAKNDGLKAREIGRIIGAERTDINRLLVSSALMRELCYQDSDFRWHALIRQETKHTGLYEFSAWYGSVNEFLIAGESEWLNELENGCKRIGRNLNDTRGLIHSFIDCRNTMRMLFEDLKQMTDISFDEWEISFETRLNMRRFIRIYADVLVITPKHVFSLEFKMKNTIEEDEILQAAKYAPFLEVVFGKEKDVLPALVLTAARDHFSFERIGESEYVLPVCSGDMLFNVFNEYMQFLQ